MGKEPEGHYLDIRDHGYSAQNDRRKKLRAIPVMLSEDALIHYSTQVKKARTYEHAMDALRN